jgi:UDP-N-acetylglucosamine/UDP-N-acetylgalactosamine diphosphorylase
VVEYTEFTREQKHATEPDGRLTFRFGSVAIHAFSLDFLKREAAAALPLHIARKKVPYCDEHGNAVKPDQPNAFKFEKFIFDVVPDARTLMTVEFQREDEFSPVKNATGPDSPATARRDMALKSARWLEACGVSVPRAPSGELLYAIEIDPAIAVDAGELRSKVDGRLNIAGDLLLR